MELMYKPEWEETKERYRTWWAGEAMDRCMLCVTAPRDGAPPDEQPAQPKDPVRRWTDLDYVSRLNEWRMRRTFYGGEAVPIWSPGYPGHAAIPTFLGCRLTLDFQTGWWDPVLTGEEWDPQALTLNKQGEWWRFALRMLRRAVKESRGKCIPSIGAFGGCGDTLAALRGTDRLLFDVVERPDLIRATEDHLMSQWFEVYDAFYEIIHEAAEGSTCWFSLWSPGKFYAAQNDFSYMISPEMFRRIFLPVIARQTEFLDHTVYHVDGIEAFRHIPALCELPRLQAIQVLPGAGKPSALHYMESLKQVQAAGKNLWIGIPAREVEEALGRLSARGLCIATSAKTEGEARELVRNACKWSRA